MRTQPFGGFSPWSFALRGVLGILIGLYMLLTPALGLVAFVLAYGIFSILEGIFAAIGAFIGNRERRVDGWLLLGGALSIGIGLLFLFRPGLSIAAMSILIAAWMLAVGISTIVSAIHYRKQIRGEWFLIIAGLFSALFGLYLLVRPIVAITLLPLMIGFYALFWGVMLLAAAFLLWRQRPGDAQT